MNPREEVKQVFRRFNREMKIRKRRHLDEARASKHHGLTNLATLVLLHELRRKAMIGHDIYKLHPTLFNKTTLYSIIHRLEELGFIATNGYGQYILTEAGLLLYKALMASKLGEEFRNSDHYSM